MEMKIRKQEEIAEKVQLQLRMRVGIIKDSNCVKVEPISLQGVPSRAGKTQSKIRIYLQRIPAMDGGNNILRSPTYPDIVEGSIAFDLLDEEPADYQFNLDDTLGNMFISVIVFDINKAGLKYFVGECVIQVSLLPLPTACQSQVNPKQSMATWDWD